MEFIVGYTTITLLICLVFFVVGLILIHEVVRPLGFPPGPFWWVPLVGNSSLLKKLGRLHGGLHKALIYLSEKYNSNIIGLKLGRDLYVVVYSKHLIKHVLTSEEFQARPDNFFIRLRTMGSRKGITMTDGAFWQEQRNFAMRHLRDLGFGKSHMENLIIQELQDLVKGLKGTSDSCSLANPLARCVLNVLWALTAGIRFSPSDPKLTSLLHLMGQRSKAFDMSGGILSQLPILAYLAPQLSGYKLICTLNKELRGLLEKTIHEHQETIQKDVTRDYIDAFLHQMNVSQIKNEETTFTEEQLIMVCLDFFIAGSQTTSNTLGFAFLQMILHQEVQERVYKEIKEVLGDRKFPSLNDRSRLPYVEAVLLESLRCLHVVPVIGPRRVLWDTTLAGYSIPKGTTVLLSLYSLHHDEAIWERPMEFNPNRFLGEQNKKLEDEMYLFSLGKRRCPGETLAKNCVFLFFCGILRNFHLGTPPGSKNPSLEPIPGIALSPKPYKVKLTLRND